jgi:hypothetical protein
VAVRGEADEGHQLTHPGRNVPDRGRNPSAVRHAGEALVVIPFRDRGIDPRRSRNLARVLDWWADSPWPVMVVDDGRAGDAQFNRSAAYNRGAEAARDAGASVVVYTEADMLIPHGQVAAAIQAAKGSPGLVVPFTTYRYLSERDSELVCDGTLAADVAVPESEMGDGASMGAVNVVSMASLDAVGGWDENFEGNWYDDNAMERAFAVCCGVRRHVPGPAWHLYHLPGWTGDHLSEADRAATEANRRRWERYAAAGTPEQIRALTGGHREERDQASGARTQVVPSR